ncbi:MAG: HD domain-containing protein, partial [Candidatus Hydrogenedentes bacterium]|nr:HD domain-containing protein [Candidatus Hydrogenedentota bacterium]
MADVRPIADLAPASFLKIGRAAEFLALIEGRLREKTLRHSVSVARMLVEIGDTAGVEPVQAVTAGLLHDLAKGMNESELLDAAQAYAIPISETRRAHPKLLHGPVAAEWCRRQLDVHDEAVCDAIAWHTT